MRGHVVAALLHALRAPINGNSNIELPHTAARVYLGDLDGELAESEAAEIGGRGFVLDVRSRRSFAAFVSAMQADAGSIDILVNNAGIMPLGNFADEPDTTTDAIIDINVKGVLTGVKLVVPLMLDQGGGHIVNVASLVGKVPSSGTCTYTASKFAIVGFSQAIRDEPAGTFVTVTAVLPGAVRTELIAGMKQGGLMPTVDPEDVARAVVKSYRTRRAITPVPAWSGAYDIIAALMPERILAPTRRHVTRGKMLGTDPASREGYQQRLTDIEKGESNDAG